MRGRRRGVGRLFLLFLALVLYLAGAAAFLEMGESRIACVFFTGTYPGGETAVEILKSFRTPENSREVCFCTEGGLTYAASKETGRSVSLRLVGILGDGALYHWQAEGFGEEDWEGCLLSAAACQELFGSKAGIGNVICIDGREYVIRGIGDWKEPLAIIRPREGESIYASACIGKRMLETKKGAAENFFMSSGLSGIFLEEDWMWVFAVCGLLSFPLVLGWDVLKRMKGLDKGKEDGKVLVIMMELLIFGAAVFWVSRHFFIPEDYVPGRWSDFSFWEEKWEVIWETLRWWASHPKTPAQAQRLALALKAGLCTILAALFGRSAFS